jgi:hypothetical protein
MNAAPSRRVPFAALALAAILAGASCSSTRPPRGASNDGLVTRRLDQVRPVEIVVPPVENHTGNPRVPVEAMRAEFQRGLVQRRYSPLALAYVDEHGTPTEASYRPGSLGEQAVLRVVLTGWDTARWASHSILVIDADVALLDASSPELSESLWGGHTTRTIDLSLQRGSFINEEAMLERAVELFADEVLAALPSRSAETRSSGTR